MSARTVYPFTAIVGQERMRLALLLHAVNPRLGGVLIRGEKGTAKSTAVRALAQLLPSVRAIEGCPFGCNPDLPADACETCAVRLADGPPAGVIERPVPVVELPIGATDDRVLGTLDLERAIQTGERHFEPGLLARANGGILYVDEVNLLSDHLVDGILDAAAMGRNYVEREGISFSHPASFMLIGTMNPEEGDLRPQLLDRFALTVEVIGLRDPVDRAEVVRRRIAFERDPLAFEVAQAGMQEQARERLARARALLPAVAVPDSALELIVRICAAYEVDGLRGDIAMYRTATALAAYAGRTVVCSEDVRVAAELALPHRRRRQPFEQPGLDNDLLNEILSDAGPDGSEQGNEREPSGGNGADAGTTNTPSGTETAASPGARTPVRRPAESVEAPGPPLQALLPKPHARARSNAANHGRRPARQQDRDGAPRQVGAPHGEQFELAIAATLRAAAPHQRTRRGEAVDRGLIVRPPDLREQVRGCRSAAMVLFLVDASGSMGARARMATAKSAVLSLLLDAYRKRDRVGMVAFRDDRAELLLPPTNSIDLAERCLRSLPTGGRTPLARGLEVASVTIERALRDSRPLTPMLIVVTDGKANVGHQDRNAWDAAIRQAERIRSRAWPVLLLNPEAGRGDTGLSRALATALGAEFLPLGAIESSRETRPRASPGSPVQHVGREDLA